MAVISVASTLIQYQLSYNQDTYWLIKKKNQDLL